MKRKRKIVIIVSLVIVCIVTIQTIVWFQGLCTFLSCYTDIEGLANSLSMYQYKHKGKNPPSLIEWMESDENVYEKITHRNKESGMDDYFIYRGGDLDENVSEDMIILYEKHAIHKVSDSSSLFVCYIKEAFTFRIGIPRKRVVLFAEGCGEPLTENQFLRAIEKDNKLRRKLGIEEKEIEK